MAETNNDTDLVSMTPKVAEAARLSHASGPTFLAPILTALDGSIAGVGPAGCQRRVRLGGVGSPRRGHSAPGARHCPGCSHDRAARRVSGQPDAMPAHTAASLEGAFFVGVNQAGESASGDLDASHLSGNNIVRRDTFWRVGGYERTAGMTPACLYTRLLAAGLMSHSMWERFGADWARHLPHSNAKRAVAGADSSSHDFLVEESIQWNLAVRGTGVPSMHGTKHGRP